MNRKKACFVDGAAGMMLLGAVGGFLDAYSFVMRGGVLATAQTGNMVFLCVALASGQLGKAASYFLPILAFSCGVILYGILNSHKLFERLRHARAIVLIFEAVALLLVGFVNDNALANAIISFVCGVQLTFFREINGNAAATTMCTGNLRCALENINRFAKTKDRRFLNSAGQYTLVIASFLAGAAGAALIAPYLGAYCVIAACAPLLFTAVCHILLD